MSAGQSDHAFLSGISVDHETLKTRCDNLVLLREQKNGRRMHGTRVCNAIEIATEFAPQSAQPIAKDSTSRGSGPIAAAEADYAKSNPRLIDAPRCTTPAQCRCSRQKSRWDFRPLPVGAHRTQSSLRARSALAALGRCCRRIRDNSFPKFPRRARSKSSASAATQRSARSALP